MLHTFIAPQFIPNAPQIYVTRPVKTNIVHIRSPWETVLSVAMLLCCKLWQIFESAGGKILLPRAWWVSSHPLNCVLVTVMKDNTSQYERSSRCCPLSFLNGDSSLLLSSNRLVGENSLTKRKCKWREDLWAETLGVGLSLVVFQIEFYFPLLEEVIADISTQHFMYTYIQFCW